MNQNQPKVSPWMLGMNLFDLAEDHAEWSQSTFGSDAERGPIGPLRHLEKEAREAAEKPDDISEYADCLLLILDASRRAGFNVAALLAAAIAKLAINKSRAWSRPRPGEPVEHVRDIPPRKANAPELHEDPPAPTTSPDLESGLSMLTHAKADLRTPRVVCLCGSLRRALDAFRAANLAETRAGNIVLSVPAVMSDEEEFGHLSPEKFAAEKARMDALHFRKIELADEILILNVGGYIGESTRRELEYAIKLRKRVRFLEANKAAG